MARTLTTNVDNLLDDDVVSPFIAVSVAFPSGTLRLWTGNGSITVDSQTYTGVGQLLSFTEITESEETKATGVQITLSGVPSTTLGTLLTDEFQGVAVLVYLGFLNNSSANQNTSVVGSIKMFSGLADNCDIAETGDTASVTLHAENRLITLQQARSRRYTHEDQQIDFSDDDGLSFVNSIVEKEILWGRG